jgi:diphthamide biosynthesis protein 2
LSRALVLFLLFLLFLFRSAGRKTYTFVVGKINIAKLGNFPLIDVFVLIAGPESSLIDAKEYHVPVVTPYEMQLALKPGDDSWTGKYSTGRIYPLVDWCMDWCIGA